MNNKYLILLLVISASIFTHQETQAQAANTYQFSAFSSTFTPITGGTNVSAIQTDDALSAALPIGFTFNFCGIDYTQLKASSNGWMTFNTALTGSGLTNNLASLNTINPGLFFLWDDLGGAGSTASYLTTGTAPNRVFTMEYLNWKWTFGSPATISIQIKLYESSNLIQYIYRHEAGAHSGTTASIGICDGMTPIGYLSLNNATATPTASSTTFTDNISTRPATGQVYQFKPLPPIDMKVDSIIVATPFCSNSTQPIAVKVENNGTAIINNVDIHWEVNGVAQTPVTYSAAPITNIITAPNNTATVVLGDVFFPDNNPIQIKAWTYQPNGIADEVPADDTLSASVAATLTGIVLDLSNQDTTICDGSSITLDAGTYPNNPIYIWSNGSITQTTDVAVAGVYRVFVQNNQGCFDRDTINVGVHLNPLANSIAITDNGNGAFSFGILGAQNIDSFFWDFGDNTGIIESDDTESHIYTASGEFTITVTMKNQCGEVVISRILVVGLTSLNDVQGLANDLKMYPNPSRDKVTIAHNGGIKMKQVEIYNLMGQKVLSLVSKEDKQDIDVSGLANGIYNVIIDTDKGRATKKLEILK